MKSRNVKPTPKSTFAAFVDDMRAGRVFGTHWGSRIAIPALERKRDWNMESFDFDVLLDPLNPDNLFDAVVGKSPPEPPRRDTALVLYVHQRLYISVRRFGVSDYPDDDDGPRYWAYQRQPDGVWESRDEEIGRFVILWGVTDTLLADRDRIEVERTPRMRLNKAMRHGGQTIPGTVVIRLPRSRAASEAPSSQGSAKRPHYRRGHFRRLRSGKVVSVRACSIHEGGPIPSYVVRE